MSNKESLNWTCPHCSLPTVITESSIVKTNSGQVNMQKSFGSVELECIFIVCPNIKCKKLTLTATLFSTNSISYPPYYSKNTIIKSWKLIPDSTSKVFSEYIPEVLINDYKEACLIKDLSPKSSATLSRRCLQGMIRDFWGIKENRLIYEIDAIKDKVDPLIWEAIDSVRKIGNIGAHMEKDINLIIDVSPGEAELLIELIEQLFQQWYVDREEKKVRLQKIKDIADSKEEMKQNKRSKDK
jgi:hypothetical protein